MKTEKDKIITAIYLYGIYPALKYLQKKENEEEYITCSKILEAINEVNCEDIETFVDEDNLNKVKAEIFSKFNNKQLIENNISYYEKEFEEYVENL